MKTGHEYFGPKEPGSHDDISTFTAHHRQRDVNEILIRYLLHTMHKPTRELFKRKSVIVISMDKQWQQDLGDLSSLAPHNDDYRYLMD